jgi:hypothetical protein
VYEPDPLARGRAQVERSPDGLRIEIPAKRDWGFAGLVLWVVIWASGGVAEIVSLAGGEQEAAGNIAFPFSGRCRWSGVPGLSCGASWDGIGGGSILFDYGARTHRLGMKLDEAESWLLVDQIAKELRLKLPAPEPERPPVV